MEPTPQQRCDDFNAAHKIGTRVTRYKLVNPLEDPVETTTRSFAWVTATGEAVIMTHDRPGYCSLDSVIPHGGAS